MNPETTNIRLLTITVAVFSDEQLNALIDKFKEIKERNVFSSYEVKELK